MGFFQKLKDGLKKTKNRIVDQIDSMLKTFSKIDDSLYEELEELLITGDVGVKTAQKICNRLKSEVKRENIKNPNEIKNLLKKIIIDMLFDNSGLDFSSKPMLILIVGVNGVGKTTTIGKLAAQLKKEKKKVILGAADTFRAAAIDQLEFWAQKAEVDIVKQKEGSDSAAVVFDTISAAKARNCDVAICDTAGRLHNKKNLMSELAKINKIITRELPNCPIECLLVLDATTGQNAINQAIEFKKIVNLTGVVLTKLDGTAKGGVILAVKDILNVPIKYIGVGEQVDDLQRFDAKNFVSALFDQDV